MTLNDTQRMLLAAATGRDDGQLYPLTRKLAAKRRDDAIRGLLDAELIAKVAAPLDAQFWREEEGVRLGLAITANGRDLLAAEEDGVSLEQLPASSDATGPETNAGSSKIARVLASLKREDGATLAELGEMTDWLPHSVRAALAGLRKKGHGVERRQRDGMTVYFIAREA